MRYLGAVRAGALAVVVSFLPMSAHAESVKAALASAYTNNPDIMAALLQVKSTAEGIVTAKAAKLPTIGVSASGTVNFSQHETEGFQQGQSFTGGLTYRQTLFDNLGTEAGIEQARALTELS